MKKTKIVATMSDFRCTEEFVKNLFDAGMDVVRVNSAHVSEEGATHIVETVHRVNPAIPIMIDTKGPEIRVTTIADEYGNSINFRPGDRVAVRGSDGSDKTTRKVVDIARAGGATDAMVNHIRQVQIIKESMEC